MDGYLGQIIIFAGTFVPQNWHLCDGTLLPITQNQALFALIGTNYGGDGKTTFGLPDLRGRTAIGTGQGQNPPLSSRNLGAKGGVETVTLNTSQIPAHNHTLTAQANVAIPGTKASTATGTQTSPANNVLAVPADDTGANVKPYIAAGSANTTLGDASTAVASFSNAATSNTGGGAAHDNMPPYLALNYIICVNGLWPVRS